MQCISIKWKIFKLIALNCPSCWLQQNHCSLNEALAISSRFAEQSLPTRVQIRSLSIQNINLNTLSLYTPTIHRDQKGPQVSLNFCWQKSWLDSSCKSPCLTPLMRPYVWQPPRVPTIWTACCSVKLCPTSKTTPHITSSKGLFALAAAVCRFCSRLHQCRERKCSISQWKRNCPLLNPH